MALIALALVVIVGGCFYDPASGVNVQSLRETISSETPGFGDLPVEKVVVIHVPAGALVGETEAAMRIGATTLSPEPFPDVEFSIADPVNESMIVDSVGNPVEEFSMPVPRNCENGCDFPIPVIITQVGEGEPPAFSWSAAFSFEYRGPEPPEAADDISVKILPADS